MKTPGRAAVHRHLDIQEGVTSLLGFLVTTKDERRGGDLFANYGY